MPLRLAACWLALIATAARPGAGGPGPAAGVVIVDAVDVLDEPSEGGFASWSVRRGDRVALLDGAAEGGFRAIGPPPGSFDWIDAAAVEPGGGGTARVIAPKAAVRSAAPGARMPGPPRTPLEQGAEVRLVDRPPLRLGSGPSARTYLAIEPGPGQTRYVAAGAIEVIAADDADRPDPTDRPDRVDDAPPGPAPPPRSMQRSADDHPVRIDTGGSPSTGPADRPGSPLDPALIRAQARRPASPPATTPAEAARRFEDAIRRSRAVDAEVARARQTLADARIDTERGYDARGFLQASSRRVEGQKVHALIGPEGAPVAFLAIPPGIATHRLLARKVGVRGEVRYDESLGARLITVRDLDPLDRPR